MRPNFIPFLVCHVDKKKPHKLLIPQCKLMSPTSTYFITLAFSFLSSPSSFPFPNVEKSPEMAMALGRAAKSPVEQRRGAGARQRSSGEVGGAGAADGRRRR